MCVPNAFNFGVLVTARVFFAHHLCIHKRTHRLLQTYTRFSEKFSYPLDKSAEKEHNIKH